MTEPHPTTIVVPLYGDVPTARRCLASVIEHVDLSVHRLLAVNDCGPEVDLIERAALEILRDVPGTEYVRNPRNLGFVGTCNRAAMELDQTDNDILLLNSDAMLTAGAVEEMSAVLYASEKHGTVTARSNHATIATIPLRTRSGVEAPPERSREVFEAIAPQLPRYSVAPVAHGFCFLARRSIIRNHGLFDPAFAPGYAEENDFCLRINDLGYSSVIANRAYVHHDGEVSFSTLDQNRIKQAHEEMLVERYPHYPAAVAHYLEDGIDALDDFADVLAPGGGNRRVLIDLHHMSLIYDGSVRNALTFLEFLQSRREEPDLAEIEFVVAASAEATEFFDLPRFGFRVVSYATINEVFDLGFSLAPITSAGQILRLDQLCARWVACHLDIIALRALPLLEDGYARRQVVLDSLRFADRVAVISHATLADTLAYFPALAADLPARSTIVPQGVAEAALQPSAVPFDAAGELTARQRDTVRAGGYVLVIGNTFRHKQLRQAASALRAAGRPMIMFGSDANDEGGSVIPLRGGYLSDADVGTLYDNAALIVYPSAYEGFGLPVAEAAQHGKRVVLFDTEVAREVVSVLGVESSAHFFSDFSHLPHLVEEVAGLPLVQRRPIRSMSDYNAGLLEVMLDTMAQPVDLDRLRARRAHFVAVRGYSAQLRADVQYLGWRLSRRSFRLAEAVVRRVEFLRPVVGGTRRALTRMRRSN